VHFRARVLRDCRRVAKAEKGSADPPPAQPSAGPALGPIERRERDKKPVPNRVLFGPKPVPFRSLSDPVST